MFRFNLFLGSEFDSCSFIFASNFFIFSKFSISEDLIFWLTSLSNKNSKNNIFSSIFVISKSNASFLRFQKCDYRKVQRPIHVRDHKPEQIFLQQRFQPFSTNGTHFTDSLTRQGTNKTAAGFSMYIISTSLICFLYYYNIGYIESCIDFETLVDHKSWSSILCFGA